MQSVLSGLPDKVVQRYIEEWQEHLLEQLTDVEMEDDPDPHEAFEIRVRLALLNRIATPATAQEEG